MNATSSTFIVPLYRRVGVQAAATVALVAALFGVQSAHAASTAPPDLQAAMTSQSAPQEIRAEDFNTPRYFNVMLVSNSAEPNLATLRLAVLSAGGAVYKRYGSSPALSVMLPLNQLAKFAARSDVISLTLLSEP